MRSLYKIIEEEKIYFITSTVDYKKNKKDILIAEKNYEELEEV